MKPIDLSNTAVPGCLAATDGEAWETLKTRCKITWVAAAAAEEAAGRAWEALGRAAALPGPWREREEAGGGVRAIAAHNAFLAGKSHHHF